MQWGAGVTGFGGSCGGGDGRVKGRERSAAARWHAETQGNIVLQSPSLGHENGSNGTFSAVILYQSIVRGDFRSQALRIHGLHHILWNVRVPQPRTKTVHSHTALTALSTPPPPHVWPRFSARPLTAPECGANFLSAGEAQGSDNTQEGETWYGKPLTA